MLTCASAMCTGTAFAQFLGNGYFFGQATNYGYTSGVLSQNATMPIAKNTRIITTPDHVYYLGHNRKICDYNYNGTNWQGGAQLDADWVFADTTVNPVNDGEDIFFVGIDNKMYHCVYNSAWHSIPVDASQTKPCDNRFPVAFAQYNGNKKLMYVCATTNKICNFYKYNNAWVYGGELNNNASSEPVLVGTQIIFDGQNHVFYIGASTHRVHNYWWTGTGWSDGVLNATGAQVMAGTDLQFDGSDIYFIGADQMVYHLYWNGSAFVTAAISPADAIATKFFTYHNDKIYYGTSTSNSFFTNVPGIKCIERVGGTWTGASTLLTGSDCLYASSDINVLSNPIYYEGSATNYFYSHQVSYKSMLDNRVHYVILDFDHGDETQPLIWHRGLLNTNAPGFSNSHTCIGYNSDPNQKMLFYPGINGYMNFFTRKVNNPASKPNMYGNFMQEFNAADPGLSDLDAHWNINWPWGSGAPYTLNNSFYHNDITHNCAVGDGNLLIASIQETGQGTEYGSANPANDAIPWYNPGACTPITYNYTSQELHTGGQNPNWSGCGPWHADPTFSQAGGIFEARLKIPRAKNAWPAFWFISDSVEIDFELGGNGKWIFCNSYSTNIGRMVGEASVGYRYYDDFYTLAINPTGTGITWYLNNEPIAWTSEFGYYPVNPLAIFVQQIVQDRNNVGVSFPNQNAYNEVVVYPNFLTVDYVRVFQNNGHRDAPPVTSATVQSRSLPELTAYPNPVGADGKVQVDFGNTYASSKLELINNQGEVLKAFTVDSASGATVDLSECRPGIYFVRISNAGQKPEVKKIVKM